MEKIYHANTGKKLYVVAILISDTVYCAAIKQPRTKRGII